MVRVTFQHEFSLTLHPLDVVKLQKRSHYAYRLHGACERNPLASLIGKLHLRLYKTSGDNSVLYDHDLER